MTREEAVDILKRVDYSPQIDFEKPYVRDAMEMAIEALEQEPILDKIIAEIEGYCNYRKMSGCEYCPYCSCMIGAKEILDIFDKYKAESEEA